MPDTKITALAAITTVDPAADVLPIVDVSDTSMAASGTTKRITSNQILGAGGTATLASATITGDLTVRTTGLIVNTTGVGVGTTPSAWSGIGPALQVEQASLLSESSNQLYLTANGYFAGGQWNYINNASADQYYQIAGSHVWRNGAGGSPGTAIGWSTLMTLNSTGLGVGTSPAYKLDVQGADNSIIAQFGGVGGRKVNFTTSANGGFANGFFNFVSTSSVGAFSFQNTSGTLLTIDAAGNCGIGVGTFGTSAAKVLSIGTGTEPTTGPAGSVQFFTSTRSANNTIPAIFTEGSGVTNAAITNTTVTNKIAIKVNGTIYYLLATTSAA